MVKEYCPSVQMVREVVKWPSQLIKMQFEPKIERIHKDLHLTCNLIKSKDDIDRLLLTIKIGQDMTIYKIY